MISKIANLRLGLVIFCMLSFLFLSYSAEADYLTKDLGRYDALRAWASSTNPPTAEVPNNAGLACDNNIDRKSVV